MSQRQQQVDLTALTVQQLQEIRKQIDNELELLTQSFGQLRQAKLKFQECINSIDVTYKPKNQGKKILVPLTASLYVSGTIDLDPPTVIVDVGTGYFVEKVCKRSILGMFLT